MGDSDKTQRSGAWITAGGATIHGDDVLLQLKLGSGAEFLGALVRRKLAVAIGVAHGISVPQEEIETALSEFYVEHDLFETDQILGWSALMQLDEKTVREHVTKTVLVERAKLAMVDDDKIRDRFATEHHGYIRVEAHRFEFSTVGQAREFVLAVRENELTPSGGARLQMTRHEAPEEIAAEIFAAEPGGFVGPVENDNGSYAIYLVRERIDAVLDERLIEEIRDEMFNELIDLELARAPIRFLSVSNGP